MAGERPRDQIREGRGRGRERQRERSDPHNTEHGKGRRLAVTEQALTREARFLRSRQFSRISFRRKLWRRVKNVGRCLHVATLGEEKIDLGRGFLVGPFLGHRRAFREQFTGAVSPASEWPCNVLQTFYRGGQRSPGGASGEGGW